MALHTRDEKRKEEKKKLFFPSANPQRHFLRALNKRKNEKISQTHNRRSRKTEHKMK
jgi:hypothetical protein